MEKMDWEKQTVLREKILFVCVMIALAIFFVKTIYIEKSANIQSGKTRLEKLSLEKNALLKFKAVIPQTPIARSPISSINPQLRAFLTSSHQQPTAPEFLQLITNAHFLRAIKVIKVSTLENKKGGGYEEFSYFLNLRGDFRDIIRYITQLESIEAVMRLDEISISMPEDLGSAVNLELKVIYYSQRA